MKTKRLQQFLIDKSLIIALLIIPCFEATAIPVYNSGNGHYYDLVTTNINWSDAKAAALSQTYLGISGHLVTITDNSENLFLTTEFTASLLHLHWLGGLQPTGSTEPNGGWSWVTGEAFVFNNWWPGEPNNAGGIEDRIVFDHGVSAAGKAWNDLGGSGNASGYVVEYDTTAVPEPDTLALLASGVVAVSFYRRKRNAVRRNH